MGLAFSQLGATRIAGRAAGLLLVAEAPLSLNELARLLQVSKASVSTNTRLLVQIGLAQRVSMPGDRRDYYQILPDAFQQAVIRRMAVIHEMIDIARVGLEAVERRNNVARARLERMAEFYAFFLGELDGALLKWRKKHPEGAR